jgi:hypothetical protein
MPKRYFMADDSGGNVRTVIASTVASIHDAATYATNHAITATHGAVWHNRRPTYDGSTTWADAAGSIDPGRADDGVGVI